MDLLMEEKFQTILSDAISLEDGPSADGSQPTKLQDYAHAHAYAYRIYAHAHTYAHALELSDAHAHAHAHALVL
jgi:hypothetical protein